MNIFLRCSILHSWNSLYAFFSFLPHRWKFYSRHTSQTMKKFNLSTDYQSPSKCLGRVATETSYNLHACRLAILVLRGAFTASITLVNGSVNPRSRLSSFATWYSWSRRDKWTIVVCCTCEQCLKWDDVVLFQDAVCFFNENHILGVHNVMY
jgi:hypothetical protein